MGYNSTVNSVGFLLFLKFKTGILYFKVLAKHCFPAVFSHALGIVFIFCSEQNVNLSELINLYPPLNHQKISYYPVIVPPSFT